jgi:hypothetical protein
MAVVPPGGGRQTLVHLADFNNDARTETTIRLLEAALEDLRAAQAAGGTLRPARAALVIRWSDGDYGETEVRAAGVDLVGLLGLLRLGSLAVESGGTAGEG